LTECKVKVTLRSIALLKIWELDGMESKLKRIKYYRTADEKVPFLEWFQNLRDITVKDEIRSRLNRVKLGNYGDWKSIGGGVSELRFRSGVRIYYAEIAAMIILLLCGGNKKTQDDDIIKAKAYWKDLKKQAKAGES
jgi:putative addiction module killer protein